MIYLDFVTNLLTEQPNLLLATPNREFVITIQPVVSKYQELFG